MQTVEQLEPRITDWRRSASRSYCELSLALSLRLECVSRKLGGVTFQDFTTRFRRRLLDDYLTKDFQRARIFTFDHRQLFGRAFQNCERLTARKSLAEKTCQPLCVMFALSRIYQFDEVAEMHDGICFLGFLPQCLTTFLPHAKSGHARD